MFAKRSLQPDLALYVGSGGEAEKASQEEDTDVADQESQAHPFIPPPCLTDFKSLDLGHCLIMNEKADRHNQYS